MVGAGLIDSQHGSWYARGVYVIMATRRGMKRSSSVRRGMKKKDDDKKKKKSRRRG